MKELGIDTVTKTLTKSSQFSFVKGDLADKNRITSLFEEYKFDVIIHLGAQVGVRYLLENPYVYIKSNIEGF